jgi:hypothetical protein
MMPRVPQLFTTNRRGFFALTMGAAATGACSRSAPTEAPQAGLVRLLGLHPDEVAWLNVLSDMEKQALHEALANPRGAPAPETVGLLMKVLGPRERLFAYVGYPALPDSLRACDGLLRE